MKIPTEMNAKPITATLRPTLISLVVLAVVSCEKNNPTFDTRGGERIEPGEPPGTSPATGNVEGE